jgi:hypothetical protein
MTCVVLGTFHITFSLQVVGQPFVKRMSVFRGTSHVRKLVTGQPTTVFRYKIVRCRAAKIIKVQNRTFN